MALPVGVVPEFVSALVPQQWADLVVMFGSLVEYWLDGDSSQALSLVLVWKDGAADEDVSPGRYSHALIQNSDLSRTPRKRDVVLRNGVRYDVVSVFAYEFKCSTIVLQEVGEIS